MARETGGPGRDTLGSGNRTKGAGKRPGDKVIGNRRRDDDGDEGEYIDKDPPPTRK